MAPSMTILLPISMTIVMLNGPTKAVVHTYQQRCTEDSTTSTQVSDMTTYHVSTYDTCDSSKLLACRGGRCECADAVNHIFTSRNITTKHTIFTQSRKKRSPNKSKGKSFVKAAVGGAAIGFAAYQFGKYVANSGKTNHVQHVQVNDNNVVSEVHRIQSSSSAVIANNQNSVSHIDGKTVKTVIQTATVYGCFGRVNANCVIDRTKKSYIEQKETSVSDDGLSITTTITKHEIEYKKYPLCIQHAECKAKSTAATSGQNSNNGQCVCKDGYQKTTTDICVARSG